jgi:hypothetical protein
MFRVGPNLGREIGESGLKTAQLMGIPPGADRRSE